MRFAARAAARGDQITTIPGPCSRYHNGGTLCDPLRHVMRYAWDQIGSGYGLAIIKRGTLGPGNQAAGPAARVAVHVERYS